MRALRTAVIFDVDGTLADCEHRRHLVDLSRYSDLDGPKKKDWKEFFRLAPLDPPVEPIRRLLLQLQPLNHIVLCTGRDEGQRDMTVAWLQKHHIPYSALFMRAKTDRRQDSVVKLELLESICQWYDPWLVVDDRSSVVNMWRDAGLTCLQCAPGDF